MTKKLASLFLLALSLSACSPKFSSGECFEWGKKLCDKWQRDCPHYVMLVLEVGEVTYHTLTTDLNQGIGGGARDGADDLRVMDSISKKVECPQLLKDKYAEFKRNH